MSQSTTMASRLRARNRSRVITCPGLDSARKIRAPPMPWGKKMMVKVRKPMPPSRCVSLRQNSRPWGTTSMSVRMVAPEVV